MPFHGAHVDPREDVLWVVIGRYARRDLVAATRRHLVSAGVRRQNVLAPASGGMTTSHHARLYTLWHVRYCRCWLSIDKLCAAAVHYQWNS